MSYTITIRNNSDNTEVSRDMDLDMIRDNGDQMELVNQVWDIYELLNDKKITF